MRLFLFLAIACFVLTLVAIGWPCAPLTLSWVFWTVAFAAMAYLDHIFGAVSVPRSPPPAQ